MRPIAVTALLISALAAAPSHAAATPAKASQIVTLTTSAVPGAPCGANERAVDAMRLADGSSQPFVIPPGKVLVITSVNFFGSGATPGRRYFFRLSIPGIGVVVAGDAGVADAFAGGFAGSVTVPNGAVNQAGAHPLRWRGPPPRRL